MMFYGDKFKSLRKSKGISLNSMAEILGKHRKTIWGWEKGVVMPSALNIKAMADALAISITDISDLKAEVFQSNELPELGKRDLTQLSSEDRAYVEKLQSALSNANKRLQNFEDREIGHDSIFDGLRLLVYTKNKKLAFTSVNKPLLDFLETDENSIIGKTAFSVFALDQAMEVDQLEKEVLKGNRINGVEISIPGRRERKGLFYGEPITNEASNRVVGLTAAIQETTSQSNALQKYKIFEKIVDSTKDTLWVRKMLPEPSLEYLSQNIYELSGYNSELFFNNASCWINQIVHPEDVKKLAKYYRDKIYNEPLEYRIITASGTLKHVEEKIIKLDEFKLTYGVISDITEQKTDEEKRILLENIVNALPYIVWSCQMDSKELVYLSEEIKQMAGITAKSFYKDNLKFIDIIHPGDRKRVLRWLGDEKNKNLTGTIKYRIVDRNGKTKWVKNKKYAGSQINDKKVLYGIIEEVTE